MACSMSQMLVTHLAVDAGVVLLVRHMCQGARRACRLSEFLGLACEPKAFRTV
jgi:hypothetical protein